MHLSVISSLYSTNVFEINPVVVCSCNLLILLLFSIPLYEYNTHFKKFISTTDGHLSCFYYYFKQCWYTGTQFLGVELLGHRLCMLINLTKIMLHFFPRWLVIFYIPTRSVSQLQIFYMVVLLFKFYF